MKFINKTINSIGPINQYSFFIAPNPPTSINCGHILPTISTNSFIGSFSCVIGDVTLGNNVYVGCNSTIRADEGTPFLLSDCCYIEDNVVLHGTKNRYYKVNNTNYSIYVGNNSTCSHGSVIHGPCIIGNNVFVGINATINDAIIENHCYISSNSYISNGVRLHCNTFVPPGAIIDTQDKADLLSPVSEKNSCKATDISEANKELSSTYSSLLCSDK